MQAIRSAPAAARNREPILRVLRDSLPHSARVLEIASGTGEHATWFSTALSGLTWQPTDNDPEALRSIAARRDMAGPPNLLPPVWLDAAADTWPVTQADAVVAINMIHVAPWTVTHGLIAGAARVLTPGGLLFLYGPFREGGVHTAASNTAFDADLRARDPSWGIRDLDEITALARRHGFVGPEIARHLARKKLTAVAEGADPSADRHGVRVGMSVKEVCDWYLEQAEAGRLLGRNRRPIKGSTLTSDRSRIETHIKPLLGARLVSRLTLQDVEGMQADIAAGKSARGRKKGRGGRSTGGPGVASRAISTLRALLGHAARLGVIGRNPADGVRRLAVGSRKRRLSEDALRHLGRVMHQVAAEGEHPTGLSAISLMLLTGFRRMEVLGLKRPWFSRGEHCVRFPDTKSGAQVRALGEAAMDCIEARPTQADSLFVFPADWGDGHFIGVVRVLDRVCRKARLEDVTPHVLRHTFASVAGDLGFSELTIAGLLGHSAHGITQRYVHLDTALVVAADRVSMEIATMLDGGVSAAQSEKTLRERLVLDSAAMAPRPSEGT